SSVQGGKLEFARLVSVIRHSTENGTAEVAPGAPAAASNTSSADSARGPSAAAPASQPAATPSTSQPVTPAAPASKPATTSGRGAKHATTQRAAPASQSFEATA